MTLGASYLYEPVSTVLTGYACFKSYQALKTPDQLDDRQWLTYWVLAGMFEVLFCITNYTLFIVPFYDEAKLGLAVFLAFGGAAKIYPMLEPYLLQGEAVVQKQVETHAPLINEQVDKAKKLVEEKTKSIKLPAMASKKPEDILAAGGEVKKDS
jgi:hypothetical protein